MIFTPTLATSKMEKKNLREWLWVGVSAFSLLLSLCLGCVVLRMSLQLSQVQGTQTLLQSSCGCDNTRGPDGLGTEKPSTGLNDDLATIGVTWREHAGRMRRQGNQIEATITAYITSNLRTLMNCSNTSTIGKDCLAPVGPQGQKGDEGEQGPKGEKGFKGEIGFKGDKGSRGIQGEQGVKGQKGEIGPIGLKGSKGDIGEKGSVGARGPTGVKGPPGPPGPKGQRGQVGQQGRKGVSGPRGPAGVKGESGVSLTQAAGSCNWVRGVHIWESYYTPTVVCPSGRFMAGADFGSSRVYCCNVQ